MSDPARLATTWARQPAGAHAARPPRVPRPETLPGPATGRWPGSPTAEMRSLDVEEAPTETITLPPRVVPGPLGIDSPVADSSLPPDRWHAWWDVAEDRAAGRPTDRHTLQNALGRPLEDLWGLGWTTTDRHTHRKVLHCARVYAHDNGETLVSACRLTRAWSGPAYDHALMATARTWPGIARCTACAEVGGCPL